MSKGIKIISLLSILALSGCAGIVGSTRGAGVKPKFTFDVTDNETPYSQCLAGLADIKVNNFPIFSVGEIADKTGQVNNDDGGHALTQGASEMVISALAKTKKAKIVERLDLRIPLAEVKLAEQKRLTRSIEDYGKIPASDFILVGALTELNYNIVSGGAQLYVKGIGGGMRTVIINVALDLRVIDSKSFQVKYVSSLQKQIMGYEIEANVFRFFGDTLVELGAGKIQNEPMQLGVRAVAEMAVYQIMTDYLKLPGVPGCDLTKSGFMEPYLVKRNTQPTAVQSQEKE